MFNTTRAPLQATHRSNVIVVHIRYVPQAALTRRAGDPKTIPIVTGFLARGETTGAITTLGRGGSDLSATIIGAALDLPEVQVWKDVDGTQGWQRGAWLAHMVLHAGTRHSVAALLMGQLLCGARTSSAFVINARQAHQAQNHNSFDKIS